MQGFSLHSSLIRMFVSIKMRFLLSRIKKHKTQKANKESSGFLAQSVEIQQKPPHPFARRFLYLVILLIVIFIVWASVSKADIVIKANGKIVPLEKAKQVQPIATASVLELFVKNGQLVEKGQPLIELDQSVQKAEINHLLNEKSFYENNLEAGMLFYHLISTEENPEKIEINHWLKKAKPEKLTDIKKTKWYRLFAQRWRVYLTDMIALTTEIEKVATAISALDEQIVILQEGLLIIEEKNQMLEMLHAKNYASKLEYLNTQEYKWEKALELNIAKAKLSEFKEELKHLHAKVALKKANYEIDAINQIEDDEVKLSAIRKTLSQQRVMQNKQILKSPVTGYVHDLKVHTIGRVVKSGETLMQIIPKTSTFEVVAEVSNEDIGYVKRMQKTLIKVNTYPFHEYGMLQGEIVHISDDAVLNEKTGMIFTVKSSIESPYLNRFKDGVQVRISSGMTAQVDIKIGTRRLISYFFSPIIRGLKESFKER